MLELNRVFVLLRESAWIIVGQAAAMLGSFALIRVFTNNLSPEKYGEFALGLTAAMVTNQIISGGVSGAIGRFYSIAEERKQTEGYLVASIWLLFWAVTVILGLILITAGILVYLDYWRLIPLILIMGFFSIMTALNSTMSGVQNAARQRSVVALHAGLDAWLRVGIALLLFYYLDTSTETAAASYFMASSIIIVSQLCFLNKLIPLSKVRLNEEKIKEWSPQIWEQAWPISIWGIFTAFQLGSDRWALGYFSSLHEVGIYTVLFQIGFVPITLLGGVLTSLMGPIMFQKAGDASEIKRIEVVHMVTKYIAIGVILAGSLAAMLAYFYHELVLGFLVDELYLEFSYLLPFFILAGAFQVCHQIFGIRVSSGLQVRQIMAPQIVSALIFCAFNIVGAFMGGIEGLVIAFSLASFLYMLWIKILSDYLKAKKFIGAA